MAFWDFCCATYGKRSILQSNEDVSIAMNATLQLCVVSAKYTITWFVATQIDVSHNLRESLNHIAEIVCRWMKIRRNLRKIHPINLCIIAISVRRVWELTFHTHGLVRNAAVMDMFIVYV